MKLPPNKPHLELDRLFALAPNLPPMTPAQLREQRISFAYGNALDNPRITREMVEKAHDAIYGKPSEPSRMKLQWQKCSCGHRACKLQYPTNLGQFYRGSGFSPEEVELLDRAFAALAALEENKEPSQ